MKKHRKKATLIIALLLAISIALCACSAKFTCDFCSRECRGEKYDLTVWGRGYVCETCYDRLCGRSH